MTTPASGTSRPATADDLKRIVRALNEQGARYLLIGAYALFAHGYQRATIDIDFLVEASVDNGERVRQALLVLADRSAMDIDPAWFTEGDNIRVADEVTVDLLFSPCAQTYEMLAPHARVIDLDGVPVRTVSLEGLLLTKQTQRPQDIQDSVILRRAIEASGEGARGVTPDSVSGLPVVRLPGTIKPEDVAASDDEA